VIPAVKVRKQFVLEREKISRVRRIVHARTDTEAVTVALDLIIENDKIESALKNISGKGHIKDIYGRSAT
jgi:hypothetical protein